MGVREQVNQQPKLVGGIVTGVLVLSAAVAYFSTRNTSGGTVRKMYYSDDDGRSFFADDTDRIFPFDHNGKPAYRAYVFQAGSGPPFVGYLSRYTDSARQVLSSVQGRPIDPNDADAVGRARQSIEVKRPGETTWVPALSSAGESVAAVRAPDGGMLHEVLP